jgi:uncharacterized lipoprotein YmbA
MLSMGLAALLAGCGGGETQYAAAFLTTDTAAALAAARANKARTGQADTAAPVPAPGAVVIVTVNAPEHSKPAP